MYLHEKFHKKSVRVALRFLSITYTVCSQVQGQTKLRSDLYCWRCHWAAEQVVNDKGHPPMQCTVCPRTFHYKCLSGTERSKITSETTWVCPECLAVLHAESSETRYEEVLYNMLC